MSICGSSDKNYHIIGIITECKEPDFIVLITAVICYSFAVCIIPLVVPFIKLIVIVEAFFIINESECIDVIVVSIIVAAAECTYGNNICGEFKFRTVLVGVNRIFVITV